MNQKLTTREGHLYYVTLTVQGWVDVFTRKEYVYEIIENLKYCQKHKALEIYAYVIMSNHLHLICKTENNKLEKVLRDFKSFTAKKLLEMIEILPTESRSQWMLYLFRWFARKKMDQQDRIHNFWKSGNYPIELRTPEMTKQKLNYLHNNPVKAGFVEEPHHWKYSSAYEFADIKVLPLF